MTPRDRSAVGSVATHDTGPAPGRPTVLLVSGLAGTPGHWAEVVDDLRVDHRVILTDRAPADALPRLRTATAPTLAGQVTDLLHVLDRHDVERALVVGHSMGAWTAEALARHAPERAAGLVLLDGSIAPVPDHCLPTAEATGAGMRVALRPTDPDPDRRERLAAAAGRWTATASRHVLPAQESRLLVAGRENAAYRRLRTELTDLRARTPLRTPRLTVVTALPGWWPRRHSPWGRRQHAQAAALARLEPQTTVTEHVIRPAPHLVMTARPAEVSALIRRD